MSAWIVSCAHIDVLVLAGVQFGLINPTTPEQTRHDLAALGADLWQTNDDSVNHHYAEDNPAPRYPGPTVEVVLDPVAVIKLLDSYEYQSCEHPGWAGSAAAGYCRRLREAAMRGLPVTRAARGGASEPVGYDQAPWSIDHLQQATLRSGSARPGGAADQASQSW